MERMTARLLGAALFLVTVVVALAVRSTAPALAGDAAGTATDPAVRAVSADPAVAAQAIAALRARGAEGLEALLAAHGAELDAIGTGPENDESRRLVASVDSVSGQKDARFARLFWYTDFDAALARAKAAGLPIL